MNLFETERILLIEPDIRYAHDVYSYSSNEEFCKYIDATPSKDEDESIKFLQSLISENSLKRRMYKLMYHKKDEKVIGSMGFIFSVNNKHKVAEFGYGMSVSYWGKGLFQEAGKEIIRFGFKELELERIQALTREDNIRSIKGIQKLGFINEAVLSSFYHVDEKRINAVLLRLLKGEFIFDK